MNASDANCDSPSSESHSFSFLRSPDDQPYLDNEYCDWSNDVHDGINENPLCVYWNVVPSHPLFTWGYTSTVTDFVTTGGGMENDDKDSNMHEYTCDSTENDQRMENSYALDNDDMTTGRGVIVTIREPSESGSRSSKRHNPLRKPNNLKASTTESQWKTPRQRNLLRLQYSCTHDDLHCERLLASAGLSTHRSMHNAYERPDEAETHKECELRRKKSYLARRLDQRRQNVKR